MLGLVGLKPGAAAYCASKGAVVLLKKQIAVEYASDKIHCNALCPGCGSLSLCPVDVLRECFSKGLETGRGTIWRWLTLKAIDLKTPMTEPIYNDDKTREGINAMTPWGEWGLVEDVAKCAVPSRARTRTMSQDCL